MASSPTVSSPSTSVLEWDEAAVNAFLISVLGLERYEDVVYGMSPSPPR
jgi:hypothetical protein